MLYRKNVGPRERWGRLLGGVLVVAFALVQFGWTPLGIGLAVNGMFLGLTGLVGWCPACSLIGRKPMAGPQ